MAASSWLVETRTNDAENRGIEEGQWSKYSGHLEIHLVDHFGATQCLRDGWPP